MPRIYALLVGINGYASKPLRGCIHDVRSVRAYLESAYGPDQLLIKELTDETAEKPTRQGLIDAFAWFGEATATDTCLLYYSGHGSYGVAPADFVGTNGWMQSFVCLDSRTPGGMDLLDKEMAYLIWQATVRQPGIDFIAITDCCHSGTITKALADGTEATYRMHPAEQGHAPESPDDYLGFRDAVGGQRAYLEDWDTDGQRRIRVAQGDHIHIAACGDSQTAKELDINGQCQGVFTHALLQALYASGGKAPYGDLLEQVAVVVKNMVPDQRPFITFNGRLRADTGLKQPFLSRQGASETAKYLLYRDAAYGWCIRAGAIDQVFKGDRVIAQGGIESRVVASPEPNLSIIQNRLELESLPTPVFATVVRNPAPTALRVSFATGLPMSIRKAFREAFADFPAGKVLLGEQEAGSFLIHADAQSRAYITWPGTNQAVFEAMPVVDTPAARHFIAQIVRVQNWLYLKEMDNPRTTLTDRSYSLELYEIDASDPLAERHWKPTGHPREVVDLSYQKRGSDWLHPFVRVAITNHATGTLWVSSAYLGFDFAISSQYFRIMEIPPGQTHWLTFDCNGYVSQSIGLQLEDRFEALGYSQVTEYIKLFLSTGDPIATSGLDQSGVGLATQEHALDKSGASPSVMQPPARASWRTETLGFRIHKSLAISR